MQEREERGIAALLDRCERFLELQQPGFEAVSWQRGMTGTKRWKEGRRGWVGLGGDYDEDLHVAGQGGEGKDEGRGVGKEALKEALKRAARRAMGRKREVSGVFARGEAEKGK